MNKLLLGLVITAAFIGGTITTGQMAFAPGHGDGPVDILPKGGWVPIFVDLQEQIDENDQAIQILGESFLESQVYEVSAVSLVPAAGATPHLGNNVQLRCLDGDWFLGQKEADKPVALSVDDPTVVIENEEIISRGSIIQEFERGIAVGFAKKIGWDGRAEQNRGLQLDDIPVTITGLCFSPSP